MLTERYKFEGREIGILRELGSERDRYEAELLRAGFPVPLSHRAVWAQLRSPARSWFVHVRDAQGAPRGGFALEVNRSRALPGHLLLRAERFGEGLSPDVTGAAIAALARLARDDKRVLRLSVEMFATNPQTRLAMGTALETAGFTP